MLMFRILSISSKIGLSINQLRKEASSESEVKLMAEAKAGTQTDFLVETETEMEAVVPEE